MIFKLIAKSFLGIIKKTFISKTIKSAGINKLSKTFLQDSIKASVRNKNKDILLLSNTFRKIERIINYFKKEKMEDLNNENTTRNYKFNKDKKKIQKLINKTQYFNEVKSEYNKFNSKIEQELIRAFKNGNGIKENDFRAFRDIFLKQNYNDKRILQNIMKDEIKLIFKSSWIFFGIFIPYGVNKQSGILCLQLKNNSKRNPSGFYQWIRVPSIVWQMLILNPNGTTWWSEFYHKNRKNMKYLTYKSIYYQPKKTKK